MKISDIQKEFDAFFDGTKTADETMSAIASLPENNRQALRRHVFSWLDGKISSDRAIALIRHSYNL